MGDGAGVGANVGFAVGVDVGANVGVGATVGVAVGVGVDAGVDDGFALGNPVGACPGGGDVELAVGAPVALGVGAGVALFAGVGVALFAGAGLVVAALTVVPEPVCSDAIGGVDEPDAPPPPHPAAVIKRNALARDKPANRNRRKDAGVMVDLRQCMFNAVTDSAALNVRRPISKNAQPDVQRG